MGKKILKLVPVDAIGIQKIGYLATFSIKFVDDSRSILTLMDLSDLLCHLRLVLRQNSDGQEDRTITLKIGLAIGSNLCHSSRSGHCAQGPRWDNEPAT